MIDGRRFDPARPGGRGEQQQCETVRTARYGDANARSGRHERVKIGRETVEKSWVHPSP
jgi:hypothetical protein